MKEQQETTTAPEKKIIFQKGDKLKPIHLDPLPGNEVAPPLNPYKEYDFVSDCFDSQGNQHINVGLVSKYNYIRSWDTKEHLPDGDKIHWCHATRFEKIAEQ